MTERIAVRHTDKKHPNHAWFAFEQGGIQGFQHPLTGESHSSDQVRDALLERARAQFPEDEGYEVRVETHHVAGTDDDGNDIGEWHPVGQSKLPLAGEGGSVGHDMTATQSQQEASA